MRRTALTVDSPRSCHRSDHRVLGTTPAARRLVPTLEGPIHLDHLATEAVALADRADALPGTDWSRPARVVGGAEVTALDLLHEAVRAGADNLRAAERTLADVRADRHRT